MKRYLDPAELSRISDLKLKAKAVVDGFLAGMHDSRLKGSGLDFIEHREYVPGDELKKLDWKILAKTGKHFVKQFKEENTLNCHILLDISNSMEYTSGKQKKFDYAVFLATALAGLIAA